MVAKFDMSLIKFDSTFNLCIYLLLCEYANLFEKCIQKQNEAKWINSGVKSSIWHLKCITHAIGKVKNKNAISTWKKREILIFIVLIWIFQLSIESSLKIKIEKTMDCHRFNNLLLQFVFFCWNFFVFYSNCWIFAICAKIQT